MAVNQDKNIRIPVCSVGKHTEHIVGTIAIIKDRGVKGIWCVDCGECAVLMFAKNKKWDTKSALEESELILKSFGSNEPKAVNHDVGGYFVNSSRTGNCYFVSDKFILSKAIEESVLMGSEYTSDDDTEIDDEKIFKVDKLKQIVYGVFLVPEKADHHGDVISEEDVEKVAHNFMVKYRAVDEMHKATTIAAEVIESAIAWEDLKYYGQEVKKGTWFGAIRILDKKVWEKFLTGKYKAFSVRISGIREPIEDKE